MKHHHVLAVLLFPVALMSGDVLAKGSSGSHSGSSSTYVHGYTRSDGTYVSPHYRASPGTASPHESASTSSAAHSSAGASSYSTTPRANSASSVGVERDENGRIKRSEAAKSEFEHQRPCPSTGKSSGSCPGYVVDHVVPLKRGGPDAPSNMQWQTTQEAKAKDKWE